MSGADGLHRDEFPTFDLVCLFDDPDHPREVTVFEPDAADVTATWITADAAHTVPLERSA